MGYEGSPKVSPSIPFGSMGKKTGSSLVATSPASTVGTGSGGGGVVGGGSVGSNSAGGQSGTSGNGGSSANSGGMSTPVPSAVY